VQGGDITNYKHHHVFHNSSHHIEVKTMRVVLLTFSMMVVEVVAGWIFGSMALFADGWHMSTHAAALAISWGAFVLARRHTMDSRFAFGTWKVEVLGGFVSGIFLGLIGLFMAVISGHRLFHPVTIRFDQAIMVTCVGLAVNLLSIFMLRGKHGSHHDHDHGHGHHHHHDSVKDNLNLRAAYLHVIADAMTSILAIVALLGAKYLEWNWLDPVMGIVGAVLIVRWTYQILRETGSILLDREADSELADQIRSEVESDKDARVCDLHLWKVGQDKYACIIALVADSPRSTQEYRKRLIRFESLVHVTIEASMLSDQPALSR